MSGSHRIGALLVALACSTSLYAQVSAPQAGTDPVVPAGPQAPATPIPEATAPAGPAAGEIVVTAQKRSERLVDVPISITAVSGPALVKAGINNSQDLMQVVPALRLDLSGGNFQPTIRGVGSALAGPGINPAVATYVDGFYMPSELSTNLEFADLASVQVLKGPQGTLFGRNSTGGAIVVTTQDPTFDGFHLHATASYGNYNDTRDTLSLSAPISDTLAASFSGIYHRNDGFVTNLFNGDRNAGRTEMYDLRGKLLWKPSDKLDILLIYDHLHNDDYSSTALNAYNGLSNSAALPGGATASSRGLVDIDGPQRFLVKSDAVMLKANYDLGFAKLASYTQYRHERDIQSLDLDLTPRTDSGISFPPHENTFTQELDLASNNHSRLNWVVGGYYYHDNTHYPSYTFYNSGLPGGTADLYDVGERTRAYAAFVDATWQFVDHLYLTVGGRYSHEHAFEFFAVPPGPGVPYTTAAKNFNAFTPRAVLRYEFAHNSNLYFSWSRGFKSGGFSPTSASTVPFKDEKIDAYEIGLKTSRGMVRFEASGFYYKYSNLQVANYIEGVAIITNAAKSTIYGADASLTLNFTRSLSMQLGAAYTHSKYDRFDTAQFYVGSATLADPLHVITGDATGRPLSRAPKFTGNVAINYDMAIGDGDLNWNANIYHTSRFNFDPSGLYYQKGYELLNARVTYTFPNKRYSIAGFAKNLTDTTYKSQVLPFGSAIAQQYGFPRTYGVEVGVKF